MNTMKAVRIHEFGDLDVLKYEEAPSPEPGEQEVVVKVHATAVNPFDWIVRMGYMNGMINYNLPLTLGVDVAGIVESVGSGVTDFSPGDEVFGRANFSSNGAYAEYIAIRQEELYRKPQSLSFVEAAAVPHVGLAAWQALFNIAGLQAGQTVLIHGAAGGVGTTAVQLAKWKGARVIGTSSAINLDFLREVGVDQAIDYNATRFEEVVKDVDVVLDLIGGDTLQRSFGVLKPGGTLVSLVEQPSAERAAEHGVQASMASATNDQEILRQLATLIDSGQLRPYVTHVLPLGEVKQAHAQSQTGHTRGKIVLQVAEEG